MERMVIQFGGTVENQKHLQLKKPLPGNLAGGMEEVEQELLEPGVNSPGVAGESSTLKKPQEAGMHLALLPRIHNLALGTEL